MTAVQHNASHQRTRLWGRAAIICIVLLAASVAQAQANEPRRPVHPSPYKTPDQPRRDAKPTERDERGRQSSAGEKEGGGGRQGGQTLFGGTTTEERPFYKKPFFIIFAALLLLVAFKAVERLARRGMRHTTTGRLASSQEVAEKYGCQPQAGGYLLGRQVPEDGISAFLHKAINRAGTNVELRLYPEQRLSHIIVQAGPGAGKTTGLFIPAIHEDAYSGVFNLYIVDRKAPEIYQMAAKVWRDKGHRVIYFDPWKPELTWGFEPLWQADNNRIEAMVQTFVIVSPDPESSLRHYREMERRVLRAVFHAAQQWAWCRGPASGLRCRCQHSEQEHDTNRVADPGWSCGCKCRRHFCTLPAVASILTKGWKATRAAIEAVRPDLNEDLADLWEMHPSRLAEMFVGLAGRMELFRQDGPAAVFSRSDFIIEDIVPPVSYGNAGPRTLLVVGAPQSHGDLATLVASLMTQLIAKAVYLRRDQMAAQGVRWQAVVPVIAMLDEFGTYIVPGIDDFVATARSGAAGVLAALQNQDQLRQWYGMDAVDRMMTNFRTEIYLKGCHARVAKDLSDRTGTKLVIDDVANRSKGSSVMSFWSTHSRGTSERPVEVPVLRPDEIEFMPEDKALVVGPTLPARIQLIRYYEDPQVARWVELSEQEVRMRTRINAQCDEAQEPRPKGEPRRLLTPRFKWSLLPGVLEAIQREDGAHEPMLAQQRAKIEAKARDLRMTGELDAMARAVCQRELRRFSRAHAQKLISHLEGLEKQHDNMKEGRGGAKRFA